MGFSSLISDLDTFRLTGLETALSLEGLRARVQRVDLLELWTRKTSLGIETDSHYRTPRKKLQ